MPKYRVHGYAMCPVEVEMFVDSPDEIAAIRIAKINFRKSDCKGDFVVVESADDRHPQQWRPSLVERVQ